MDTEIEVLTKCTELLSKLDKPSRDRALTYLVNRFSSASASILETKTDYEEILNLLIGNSLFFKFLVSMYYPFSLEELKKFKDKILFGEIYKGTFVEKSDDYFDEDEDDDDDDDMVWDEEMVVVNYGLIFNSNIDWRDNDIKEFYKLYFDQLKIKNLIEYNLPVGIEKVKQFDLDAIDDFYTDQFQVIGNDEEDFIERELSSLGISTYSTNERGEIIDPPELNKAINDFNDKKRAPLKLAYSNEVAEIEKKFASTIFNEVSIDEIQNILEKDGLYILKNPIIWEKTFKKILNKDTIERVFQAIK
ncbi:hypothetical protein [Mucilaginibacter dorajii]|uniref:Uncharacterized protein n=1 Tax=Mucilaginibacter dorajii TaxID=692994 RepID=A0ABP7QPL0_9SPHI|nr:hypothetical protein [Mucilaginibacter dorajii]MCS3733811.1 hypothetical protein [Mucilaginibacter dorajii]